MGHTSFIPGIQKSLGEEEINIRKKNFKKIRKFLIRQTGFEGKRDDNEMWKNFKTWDFHTFLFEVGMLTDEESILDHSKIDEANEIYLQALFVGIKGNGAIFVKLQPKDVFNNKFNPKFMKIHEANHDNQII